MGFDGKEREKVKLVVQRVKNAKVTSVEEGKVTGEIGTGLLVLVGFGKEDNERVVINSAIKLIKLRIMADKNDKMNLSVKDIKASVLVVSQFTLYADISAGNRPSFINAADPDKAKAFYELFIEQLNLSGVEVQTGSFGQHMEIEAVLDGPVTILY